MIDAYKGSELFFELLNFRPHNVLAMVEDLTDPGFDFVTDT